VKVAILLAMDLAVVPRTAIVVIMQPGYSGLGVVVIVFDLVDGQKPH
jgi:hypothetical protein